MTHAHRNRTGFTLADPGSESGVIPIESGLHNGFTLVELIVVIIIIGIVSMMAVPMMSSAADMQARSAANRIAADLDYAKSLAMTHQKGFSVVFDPGNETYDIRDTATDTVVTDPMRPGRNYVVDIANDGNLSRVNIVTSNFDSDVSNAVTFNYLGAPYRGKGLTTALGVGRITLRADTFTLYVDVEPVTGYVTITGP